MLYIHIDTYMCMCNVHLIWIDGPCKKDLVLYNACPVMRVSQSYTTPNLLYVTKSHRNFGQTWIALQLYRDTVYVYVQIICMYLQISVYVYICMCGMDSCVYMYICVCGFEYVNWLTYSTVCTSLYSRFTSDIAESRHINKYVNDMFLRNSYSSCGHMQCY